MTPRIVLCPIYSIPLLPLSLWLLHHHQKRTDIHFHYLTSVSFESSGHRSLAAGIVVSNLLWSVAMGLTVVGVANSTCTLRVLATLFEKQVEDFKIEPVHFASGEHRKPEYLKLQVCVSWLITIILSPFFEVFFWRGRSGEFQPSCVACITAV